MSCWLILVYVIVGVVVVACWLCRCLCRVLPVLGPAGLCRSRGTRDYRVGLQDLGL